jgi:hypothetical protein
MGLQVQKPIFQTLLDVFWGRKGGIGEKAPTQQGEKALTQQGEKALTQHGEKALTQQSLGQETGRVSQSAQLFVREAERLVSHSVASASPVPLRNYYPNYQAMNPAQRKWYLCWRAQVRKGSYPSTDSAYVLIHAYELINGVGIKSHAKGFEQLRGLWRNYRSQHPILDRSLMGWLEDFALLHGLESELAALRQEVLQSWRESYYPNTLGALLVQQGWSKVPLALVAFWAQVDLQSKRFYQEGHQQLFERYVPLVLDQIDQAFIQGSQQGILGHFGPPAPQMQERPLFSGAIYAEERQKIWVMPAPSFLEHPPLRNFLKSVLAYTEQRLREASGYPPPAQALKVLPWLKAQIDSVIPERIALRTTP